MSSALTERYGHKIKTVEELLAVIGPFPRDEKVIMCHGVFDVVHPGHVRHLLFAKGKAEILIASITADKHISKGTYRPHVPQDLRAINLAALELVDYILIDKNPTPLDNIHTIQPDYFAKGYEYVSNGVPQKTADEAEVIEAYGGEIIFTPGDIVYSSSNLIEAASPTISIEKLLTLMDAEGIDFNTLRNTVEKLGGFRVHVVGDTIVDSYTYTTMAGSQAKTPTMSVLYENRIDFIGGAAIVAKHLRAAGAAVTFSTVLGQDASAEFVLNGLKEADIDCRSVIVPTRATTNKNAIVAGGYRLLKIDTVDNSSISDHVLEEISHTIRDVLADAVVFSDFRHGIFNRRTIPKMTQAIPDGTYRVADSQVASRWGNITEFKGFDLITPNEREARFSLADQDSGIRPLAAQLYEEAQCNLLIMKLGDRGTISCRGGDHDSLDSFFVVDSFVDNLVDAVGAGDALLSYSTLAMLATNSEVIATILGSMAAACECEREGNIPIVPVHVMAKIDDTEKKVNFG